MDLSLETFAQLSSDDEVSQQAAFSLVAGVLKTLASHREYERFFGGEVGGVPWTEVWQKLTELLGVVESPKFRKEIVRVLGRSWLLVRHNEALGDSTTKAFIKALQDTSVGVRLSAVSALGKTGRLSVIDTLAACAEDEHPQVRLAVYAALGKFVAPRTIPILYQAYCGRESDDDPVYETCIGALQKFGISAEAIERFDLNQRKQSLAAQIEAFQRENSGDWHNVLRSLLLERNILAIGEVIGHAGDRAYRLRGCFKKAMASLESSDERLAILRSLLSQPVSAVVWRSLLDFLHLWPDEPEREMALMYAEQHLESWPSALRLLSDMNNPALYEGAKATPVWSLYRAIELSAYSLDMITQIFGEGPLPDIESLCLQFASNSVGIKQTKWKGLLKRFKEGVFQELCLSFSNGQLDKDSWHSLHRAYKGTLPFALVIQLDGFGPDHLHGICPITPIRPIARISFLRCTLGAALITKLMKAKFLGDCTDWVFRETPFTTRIITNFFASPRLGQAISLVLAENSIHDEQIEHLVAWMPGPDFSSLSLAHNPLTDDALAELTTWPGLAQLTSLALDGTCMTTDGLTRFLDTAPLDSLRQLSLGDLPCTEDDVARWQASKPALHDVDISR